MQTLSESDTKAKLIDPVLHSRSWIEDLIHREETACGIDMKTSQSEDSEVLKAGGLSALKILGNPDDIILETKGRLLSA